MWESLNLIVIKMFPWFHSGMKSIAINSVPFEPSGNSVFFYVLGCAASDWEEWTHGVLRCRAFQRKSSNQNSNSELQHVICNCSFSSELILTYGCSQLFSFCPPLFSDQPIQLNKSHKSMQYSIILPLLLYQSGMEWRAIYMEIIYRYTHWAKGTGYPSS